MNIYKRKKKVRRYKTLGVILAVLAVAVFMFSPKNEEKYAQTGASICTEKDGEIVQIEKILKAKPVYPLYTLKESEHKAVIEGDLQAKSAIMIDIDTKEILFAKEMDKKMYPASTTKVLTAITAMDYLKSEDTAVVGDEIMTLASDASRASLVVGEHICIKDLMYGLLLPSGNDAAKVFAVATVSHKCQETVDYDTAIEQFTKLMNENAKKIGATNSNFVTVDGWHDDNHYTTAKDMSLIALKANENELIKQVVNTDAYKNDKGNNKYRMWINTNQLIQKKSKWYMEGVSGFKTGYTDMSGKCLIVKAKIGKRNVMIVLLGSTKSKVYEDAHKLLHSTIK